MVGISIQWFSSLFIVFSVVSGHAGKIGSFLF